jgi:hypothetical protein
MRLACLFVSGLLLLCPSVLVAKPSKDASKDKTDQAADLARVAVMTFINESNNVDYEWVEKSLPDAINDSMRARFEFVRQDEQKVMAIAAKYKQIGGEYQIADADKIAKESQTDILIYGSFRTNEAKDQLLFKAIIYNAQGKKIIGVVEDTSSLDAKIFKAIDRMAAGIVEKIYAFALNAEREKGGQQALKVLVLVPSYSTAEEEQQAIRELEVLKAELSETYMGRYLTIYEFYQEFKVTATEREKSLGYAKRRERDKIVNWLAGYGIRNAFIVLVAEKKVAITPVAQGKPAPPVTYAVNAKPEEKKASIAKASEEVTPKNEKVDLKKDTFTNRSVTLLHVGLLGGKSILAAGNNLGPMTGLSAQFGMAIWKPWLQPQVRFAGYYMLQKGQINYLAGGSLEGGLGYTWLLGSRTALTPYVMGGVFAGVVKNPATTVSFNLPLVSAGLTFTYFLGARWGISLNSHTHYVIDRTAPGLFFTGALSWVYRF